MPRERAARGAKKVPLAAAHRIATAPAGIQPPMSRLAAAVVVLVVLALPGAAVAADSQAPRGAGRNWLPNEDWVMQHWLPYDLVNLERISGMSVEDMRRYFRAPGPTVPPLADALTARGIDPGRLARRLVAAGHPSRARRATLLRRADLTLTQGHLLQHLLFHPLHSRGLTRAVPAIFGVPNREMAAALRRGMSRREVGEAHGRTRDQMIEAARAALRRAMQSGRRHRYVPSGEARRELDEQQALVPQWLELRGPGAANPQREIRAKAFTAVCHLDGSGG